MALSSIKYRTCRSPSFHEPSHSGDPSSLLHHPRSHAPGNIALAHKRGPRSRPERTGSQHLLSCRRHNTYCAWDSAESRRRSHLDSVLCLCLWIFCEKFHHRRRSNGMDERFLVSHYVPVDRNPSSVVEWHRDQQPSQASDFRLAKLCPSHR